MVRYAIFAVALVIAVFTFSCVPVPHMETQIPTVEGVLLDGQKPVAGHTIIFRLGLGGNWRYTAQTVTSAGGEFHIPGKSRFEPVMYVPLGPVNYGISEYELVLRYPDGSETVLHRYFVVNPPGTTKRIKLECDLEKCKVGCCKAIEE